jgi:hypothetical protein
MKINLAGADAASFLGIASRHGNKPPTLFQAIMFLMVGGRPPACLQGIVTVMEPVSERSKDTTGMKKSQKTTS